MPDLGRKGKGGQLTRGQAGASCDFNGLRIDVQALLPIATTGEAANLPHINDDIRYLNLKLTIPACDNNGNGEKFYYFCIIEILSINTSL